MPPDPPTMRVHTGAGRMPRAGCGARTARGAGPQWVGARDAGRATWGGPAAGSGIDPPLVRAAGSESRCGRSDSKGPELCMEDDLYILAAMQCTPEIHINLCTPARA